VSSTVIPVADSFTEEDRVRRTVRVADYCLKNIAYYRAGRPHVDRSRQFWVTASNNFLDTAILEWCKLFADRRDRAHYWKRTVTDHAGFIAGLLATLGMNQQEYIAYIQAMERERDKFIAHLDKEKEMRPPVLDAAQLSAEYLHDYLVNAADTWHWLTGVGPARGLYEAMYREADREYCAARGAHPGSIA
jgi:hypothetical protein